MVLISNPDHGSCRVSSCATREVPLPRVSVMEAVTDVAVVPVTRPEESVGCAMTAVEDPVIPVALGSCVSWWPIRPNKITAKAPRKRRTNRRLPDDAAPEYTLTG